MKTYSYLLLFLILINCSNADYTSKKQDLLETEKQIKDKANCKEDFTTFFKKFSSNKSFQKQRLTNNLTLELVDVYENTKTDTIVGKNYPFISFKDNLSSDIDRYKFVKQKKNDTIIYVRKGIDNGIYISYYFSKRKGCWFLVKILDESN